MKRLSIVLVSILIVVYLALSVFSSGEEYAAEKLFYKAMKTYSKIIANPDVAPPAMIASVEKDLKSLHKKYPKSAIAKTAHILIAEMSIANKKYDEAQATIKNIMDEYKDDLTILSMAQFMKGTIYEKTGRIDKALAEFRILRDKYPYTKLGLQIPLYIGRYYETKNDDGASQVAYKEAAAYYRKLEENNSKKVLGYMASTLLIQTYMNLKDFEAAGSALEATLINYASLASFNQLLPLVEIIYVDKLKSPERAIALYRKSETLIYKGNRIKELIDKRIATLEKPKK